jgi:hypothetical protein
VQELNGKRVVVTGGSEGLGQYPFVGLDALTNRRTAVTLLRRRLVRAAWHQSWGAHNSNRLNGSSAAPSN